MPTIPDGGYYQKPEANGPKGVVTSAQAELSGAFADRITQRFRGEDVDPTELVAVGRLILAELRALRIGLVGAGQCMDIDPETT